MNVMQTSALIAPSVEAWFHPKFECLFKPKRYKVFYGGRGGLKSWSIASALVLMGAQQGLRILCARELQKSIKESVHQLLEGQIKRLGLESYYDIQRDTIRGIAGTSAEGTEFFFIGLHLNSASIKSYEDVDIVWIEEAANVLEASWKYVTPTIRKPTGGPFGKGSEIWVSFNPELDTDATYKRFVLKLPHGESERAFVVKTTYHDNPFLNDDYLAEIRADKEDNEDDYLWVWEGHCKQALEGAVYKDELRAATKEGRITRVPYDHAYPVSCYFDLGRSDHTSIWFVQRVGFEWRVIDFYEERLKHIDHYIAHLKNSGYLLGDIWLPHDATAQQLGSKMTIEEQMKAKFPNAVRIVPKAKIKDKVAAARTVFNQCYFDEIKCSDGLQRLRHYTYEVKMLADMTKQYSQKPKHDENSDAGSAFEYFALASGFGSRKSETLAKRMSKLFKRDGLPPIESGPSSTKWMS